MDCRYLFGLALIALVFSGCKEKAHPCSKPPGFDKLPTPAEIFISKDGAFVGVVTIGADHVARFSHSEKASEEHLTRFREDFAAAIEGDSVGVRFHRSDGDGRYSCGASVKKGDPDYPGALKWHLRDEYWSVSDKAPVAR